jgi:hypothetical protein
MARAMAPRTIRSGPYIPSAPRTGGEGDSVIFRKRGLITRGRDGRFYEEAYSGLGDLDENLDLGLMTGTLSFTADSTTVTGVGTLFQTEANLGQRLLVVTDDDSAAWLIVPKRIVSDTEMVVWKAPDTTTSGLIGYRMPRLFAVVNQRGTAWWGNVLKLDRGSLVGVGDGPFQLDGLPITAPLTLTRDPQLALFDAATSLYSVSPLGMDEPAPPALAEELGTGTKNMAAGIYGIVVTPRHAATGGYNNPSVPATVTLTAPNSRVVITFPAMDTVHLQDSWGIWVTPYSAALSSDLNYLNGPFFFWKNITAADMTGLTYTTEWLDSEVEFNETVGFNNDPPPQAIFVELLDFKLVYISCFGVGTPTFPDGAAPGPFITPTKPNNIDAAPPDLAQSSSPPETILGAVSAQGRLYLLTANHLQIAMSTGRDDVPIIIRPYWKDGFAGPEQLVFINGMLYGFTVAGPSRSAGDGDESYSQRDWAADVYEITKDWNPGQVLVGFDPKNNLLCFFHTADHLNSAGFWTTRVLGYGLSQAMWVFDDLYSSNFEDKIVCGVATVAERLEVLIGGRGVPPPAIATAAWSTAALQWNASGEVGASGDAEWPIP